MLATTRKLSDACWHSSREREPYHPCFKNIMSRINHLSYFNHKLTHKGQKIINVKKQYCTIYTN